jgi:hypothetical protein
MHKEGRVTGPTSAERDFWEEQGYLAFEQAIVGDDLSRLQAAFDRAAADCKADWLEGIARGKAPAAHFDISNPFERDDVFINLIDYPAWYPYLMDFAEGELILLAPQVRTLPAQPISYLVWHADVPHTNPLHMKLQIYVEDVPEDGGAFAYVPGSHKPDAGPCPQPRPLDAMPGRKVFPGKAGDAILFNSYGWHTSMVNETSSARKSIILIFEQWTEGRVASGRNVSIADRLTTPARRKLFGHDPMRG